MIVYRENATRRTAQGEKDMTTKAELIESLRQFAEQRPGLEFGNYADTASYRAESRRITRQLADAKRMLLAVERMDSIGADDILAHLRGRLTWDTARGELDYCTGQYFPVEYRAAVCSAVSSVLWAHFRETGCKTAPDIRKAARRWFDAGLVARWFN